MNANQARQQLTEATARTAQAAAYVEEAREAMAVSEATQSDVARAQRAHLKAQEHEAQAQTNRKVAERREAVEQAHIQAESERIRRELDRITRQKATVEAEKYREWLLATAAAADGYQQRLAAFEAQLGRGSLIVPGRFVSFAQMSAALKDQLFHFTKPTNYGEA